LPNSDKVNSDYVMVGANWKQKMGGMSVKISGGYGTVTDTAEATLDGEDSKDEPEAMNFGIVLGVGGLTGGVSYANFSDHGKNDAEGINAGVAYAQDGWGISLAYFHGEKDGDTSGGTPETLVGQAESDVIHLSGKYAMGPGVTLAGTLGHSEYTSKDAILDNNVDEVSATYLVMGLKVGF
jgi:predicted porin